jgi:tRNA (adenine22-N1)-methyltransferase
MAQVPLKLSRRLKKIDQMVSSDYQHLWDCCCDHGLLGAALLGRKAAPTVHFVDIVPDLMAKLERKLQRFYPSPLPCWKTHCIDVTTIPLADYAGKHLVIIAGVGGDLITQFIECIHQQHPNMNIDFLLCPVHHPYRLRQMLIKLGFSLLQEVLVEENQRFYEILHVCSSRQQGTAIYPVGDSIWQSDSAAQAHIAQRYLNKTLSHYQRILKGQNNPKGSADTQEIFDAYLAVGLTLKARG